jgi:hypothetical protein
MEIHGDTRCTVKEAHHGKSSESQGIKKEAQHETLLRHKVLKLKEAQHGNPLRHKV